MDRGGIANLYARWGTAGPAFGFNGHTDVVPPGDESAWTHPPFSGALVGGEVWGRGAVDMKSGVAAFVAAAAAFVTETPPAGSVALLITGDEEGAGVDGTRALLDGMAAAGERLDACLVGEPTCVEALGDMAKIGRRGAMTVTVTARGVQGHAAYPQRARNPLHPLVRLLDRWASTPLDHGTAHFDPSTLQVVSVDVGNPASNVIPAAGRATVNIRFNDAHAGGPLLERLRAEADALAAETGVALDLAAQVSGESFLTPPGPLSDLVSGAAARVTGRRPALSTTGGTSDARFVKNHCPVIEFGLVGRGMHAIDERAPVEEVRGLAAVYREILAAFFAGR
jgi:succinyl-diaminopimelate desuccinylase